MRIVYFVASIAPYSATEFMLGVIVATMMVLVRIERVPPKDQRTFCGVCKFDLAGLADHARCPECSSTLVETSKPKWTLGVHISRLKVASLPLALTVLLLLAGDAILSLLVLPGYLRDGYDLETSLRVIPKREGDDGWLGIFYPFAGSLIIALFAAMVEDRSHAWACSLAALALGLLISVPNVSW